MSDPFLGTIRLVGFNFAPVGWALCQGQSLPISQNTALFSLIGTYFGGDGVNTFNLPDLRGRVAVSQGQGTRSLKLQSGADGGAESVTLTGAQAPAHTHTLMAASNVTAPNPGTGPRAGDAGNGGQAVRYEFTDSAGIRLDRHFRVRRRSRKQAALSGAQLHYRSGRHLPVAKLIQRLFDGPVSRTDQHFRLQLRPDGLGAVRGPSPRNQPIHRIILTARYQFRRQRHNQFPTPRFAQPSPDSGSVRVRACRTIPSGKPAALKPSRSMPRPTRRTRIRCLPPPVRPAATRRAV